MKRSFMKLLAFFLIFLGFISSSPVVNSQATNPCSSDLKLNRQLPFNTTSFVCNSVWSPHGYVLRYIQAEPRVWNFVLSAPNPNTYIAIGFSPNGRMVGSSAIAGWFGRDGVPAMKKYYLGGQSPDLVEPDSAQFKLELGKSDILIQDSQIHIAFQLINTDRPETRVLYAIGPSGWFPTSNNRLIQHSDMVPTSIDYATGQSQTEKDPDAKLRRSHGILNILGWGILVPIGMMVARYLRKFDPLWFYLHTIIQSIGFSLGVAGIICGLVLEDRLDNNNIDSHKAIGLTILSLGCTQVIAFFVRPDKDSKCRKYWNWNHYTIGRILIILAVANIFYGIHLADGGGSWNAGYAVAIVILFITGVLLEFRMWRSK